MLRRRYSFRLNFLEDQSRAYLENMYDSSVVFHLTTSEERLNEHLLALCGLVTGKAASVRFGQLFGECCLRKGHKCLWFHPPIHRTTDFDDAMLRFDGVMKGMVRSGLTVELNPHHLLQFSTARPAVDTFWARYIEPLRRHGVVFTDTPIDVEATYKVIDADSLRHGDETDDDDDTFLDETLQRLDPETPSEEPQHHKPSQITK